MAADAGLHGRLPPHFTTPGSSSFSEFLGHAAPDLLPSHRELPGAVIDVPHGTTIVAVVHASGVIMAGEPAVRREQIRCCMAEELAER